MKISSLLKQIQVFLHFRLHPILLRRKKYQYIRSHYYFHHHHFFHNFKFFLYFLAFFKLNINILFLFLLLLLIFNNFIYSVFFCYFAFFSGWFFLFRIPIFLIRKYLLHFLLIIYLNLI
jgi:hypothetical protein